MEERADSPSIAGDTVVVRLLEAYPQTEEVMVSYGFTCVGSPILRKVLPPTLTLETAAGLHGVDVESLLDALKHAAATEDDAAGSP